VLQREFLPDRLRGSAERFLFSTLAAQRACHQAAAGPTGASSEESQNLLLLPSHFRRSTSPAAWKPPGSSTTALLLNLFRFACSILDVDGLFVQSREILEKMSLAEKLKFRNTCSR
jgi:hypothetical protein